MLIKLGVDISRLKRPARRSLNVVERVFRAAGEEPVITSTYEGNHSPASLHYIDLAYDVRMPPPNKLHIFDILREDLDDNFDLVLKSDHIHIEYDPAV